jgi:hypothetical protein
VFVSICKDFSVYSMFFLTNGYKIMPISAFVLLGAFNASLPCSNKAFVQKIAVFMSSVRAARVGNGSCTILILFFVVFLLLCRVNFSNNKSAVQIRRNRFKIVEQFHWFFTIQLSLNYF